jgi:hypothetical protein
MWSWIKPPSGVPSFGTKKWLQAFTGKYKWRQERNLGSVYSIKTLTKTRCFTSGYLTLRKMGIHFVSVEIRVVMFAVRVVESENFITIKNTGSEIKHSRHSRQSCHSREFQFWFYLWAIMEGRWREGWRFRRSKSPFWRWRYTVLIPLKDRFPVLSPTKSLDAIPSLWDKSWLRRLTWPNSFSTATAL